MDVDGTCLFGSIVFRIEGWITPERSTTFQNKRLPEQWGHSHSVKQPQQRRARVY